jgi:PAS domain S-box-containing protein
MGSALDPPVRVLHVDDDRDFAELTATVLEDEDDRLAVDVATDAAEGLERLDGDVDCVVSDYDMPGTNGIEFLEAVREDYPDLPFILFTGKGSEEVASDAISSGVTDYLQKRTGTDNYALLANRLRNAVERYRAEREVDETRERFRTLLADSGDYIHVLDFDGTIRYVTPSVERVLGYEQADVEGEVAVEVVHPADRETVLKDFERIREDPEGASTIEVRVRHEDGSWRWVEVKSRNLLDNPAVEGIVGSARDVTERREREQALERQRQRFSALFENFPEPTFTYEYAEEGGEPIIRAVNDAFEETFGYDETEAVGAPVDDLVVPPEKLDEARDIDRRVRKGVFVDEVLRRQTGDGERYFNFRNIPIPDEGESEDGFAVYIDIGDRKRREEELRRQNERLEEFTRIVSHDLRNPLNVAQGQLAIGREEADNEHFEAVDRAHERMETLIEDLLTLAREGDPLGSVAPVDLATLCRGCWEYMGRDGASLTVETDLTVRADEARLRQLVENLLGNAVDHGGSEVSISVGDLGDGTGFFVADDGPGVPADRREQVFEASFSTAADGIGLGLSIVREIADAHGWDVRVTDSDAGGARFEVRGAPAAD